tara:strand:- start:102 stop:878 length:777 start_codon:yes stop_codon:yes gene_type:complete
MGELLLQIVRPLILPFVILIIWQLVHINEVFLETLFPGPKAVWLKFWEMTLNGELFIHVGVSLRRVVLGFILAMAVAIPFGLILGWYKKAEKFCEVVIHIGRTIPIMAWIPLTIMWFGMGELSSVLIIMLGAFFPTFFNTIAGVREVNKNHIDAAMNLGVKPNSWMLFKEVVLPSSIPFIITGQNISLGYALSAIVAAELIFKNEGIGYLLMSGRIRYSYETVILMMIILCLLGLILNIGIKLIESKLSSWRYGLKIQ